MNPELTQIFLNTKLQSYYEALRLEVSQKRIAITVVCPGLIQTEMIKPTDENDKSAAGKEPSALTCERATRLLLVAGANQLSEAWFSKQPSLLLTNVYQVTGPYLRRVLGLFCTQPILRKFYAGINHSKHD